MPVLAFQIKVNYCLHFSFTLIIFFLYIFETDSKLIKVLSTFMLNKEFTLESKH